MESTMSFAGLYGRGTGLGVKLQPAEQAVASASGPADKNASPTLFWVAIVGLLIGVRLLYELAE
jgi:hypothetical protein